MLVINYGGGTNSMAMLLGAYERGIRPDVILFSDTLGEMPHTYASLAVVSGWCLRVGFPPITVVRRKRQESLEDECLRTSTLPSKAYGFGRCSDHHKIRPMMAALRLHPEVTAWRQANPGQMLERWIGYDADEVRRSMGKSTGDAICTFRYPLIEWGWGRDECKEAIARHGLPQPGKSACFFCPNSKPAEVRRLRATYPDLFARALTIEEKAWSTRPVGSSIVGLGRSWRWTDIDRQADLALTFDDTDGTDQPCGCYDGAYEETTDPPQNPA